MQRSQQIVSGSECENGISKKSKPNICVACLGIFQHTFIEEIATEIIKNSNLSSYDCDTLYTSITIPISLQVRELSLWIALIKQFPKTIEDGKMIKIDLQSM